MLYFIQGEKGLPRSEHNINLQTVYKQYQLTNKGVVLQESVTCPNLGEWALIIKSGRGGSEGENLTRSQRNAEF